MADKIKELPLLYDESGTAYPPWDWQADEDRQTGYNALISNGPVTDFSHYTWNELVEWLDAKLMFAGLDWVDSFGSVEETKVSTENPVLTAKRFNAMVYNIDYYLPRAWSWWCRPEAEGYVGRIGFQGLSDSINPDIVYGAYFLELTAAMNKFLEVLKNEADFSEFDAEELSECNIKANLKTGKGAGLDSSFLSESLHASIFELGKGIGLKAREQSFSEEEARLKRSESSVLIWRYSRFSDYIATAEAFRSRLIVFAQNILTLLDSTLRRALAGVLVYPPQKILSMYEAEAKRSFAAKIKGRYLSASTRKAVQVFARKTAPLYGDFLSATKLSAGLIAGKLTALSNPNSLLSLTRFQAEAGFKKSARLDFAETSLSKFSANFRRRGAIPFAWKNASATKRIDILRADESAALVLKGKSASTISAILSFYSVEPEWFEPVQRGSDLYIRSVYRASEKDGGLYIDVFVWYNPIQEGSDLYIRQAFDVWQQNENLNIETEVFFVPEQRGSDLYIKSVDTLHQVDDNADVDMDYYAEPVQTGSNLYIRQDFLGGA